MVNTALNIALIQMNAQEKAKNENVEKACRYIDQICKNEIDLIVFPEFFNTTFT